MMDDLAYLIAQRRTADRAREALPGSPLLPDHDRPLRRRLSVALRRLADRLEPVPHASATTGAECR